MEAHDDYLQREPSTKDHKDVLRINADKLDECVNFGTHLLTWCTLKLGNSNSHELTIIMLARHVLESLDAVAVLFRQGSVNSSESILRSMFEATIGIEYILRDDTRRRALAYQVTLQRQRLVTYRKLEHNFLNEENSKELRRRKLRKKLLERSKKIRDKLESPGTVEINSEWKRVKKAINRNPNWFTLFGGPRTIEQLAGQLGYGEWYDVLYRNWSTGVHATGTFNNIVPHGKGVIIVGLRSPRNLQTYSSIAISMTISVYRLIIKYFIPEMERELATWYLAEMQGWCLRLSSEEKLIRIVSE